MKRDSVVGTVAAVLMAIILVVIDAIDFSREPATDNADVVATLAAAAGLLVWFAWRWADTTSSRVRMLRAMALGVASGAIVTGLVSAVYDPFAP